MLRLKAPVRPQRHDAVEHGQAQGEQVETAPDDAQRGDEGVGEERPTDAADAVGAVHGAQRRGAVGETAAEDVAQREGDGRAEAHEEVGGDDGGEGRRADDDGVAARDEQLGEREGAAPTYALAEGVDEPRAQDKTDSLTDEDEGNYRVSDIVVSMLGVSSLARAHK